MNSFSDLVFDSNGDVYGTISTANNNSFLFKFSQNGYLIWQRQYSVHTKGNIYRKKLAINKNDEISILAHSPNSYSNSTLYKFNVLGNFYQLNKNFGSLTYINSIQINNKNQTILSTQHSIYGF